MTAVDLEQAKKRANEIFESALNGNEIVITSNATPVLRLTRIDAPNGNSGETNAIERLKEIRISATPDFSANANLYELER